MEQSSLLDSFSLLRFSALSLDGWSVLLFLSERLSQSPSPQPRGNEESRSGRSCSILSEICPSAPGSTLSIPEESLFSQTSRYAFEAVLEYEPISGLCTSMYNKMYPSGQRFDKHRRKDARIGPYGQSSETHQNYLMMMLR